MSILGDGFGGQVVISLGSYQYTSGPNALIAYDSIHLTTLSDQNGDYELSVVANGVMVECLATCNFSIRSAYTPLVTSASPSSVSDSSSQVVITGSNFGSNSEATLVHVGSSNCTIVSVSDTSITCALLSGIDLGDQAIEVITGKLI